MEHDNLIDVAWTFILLGVEPRLISAGAQEVNEINGLREEDSFELCKGGILIYHAILSMLFSDPIIPCAAFALRRPVVIPP